MIGDVRRLRFFLNHAIGLTSISLAQPGPDPLLCGRCELYNLKSQFLSAFEIRSRPLVTYPFAKCHPVGFNTRIIGSATNRDSRQAVETPLLEEIRDGLAESSLSFNRHSVV